MVRARPHRPGARRTVGGLDTVAPGADASFQTELKRGKYLLLRTMAGDEGRHDERGMIDRFEIE